MTTKTITSYSAGGYSLSAAYSELDITAGAGFGEGVYSGHYATVVNAGTVRSTTTIGVQIGVLFRYGGTVVNEAGGYIGSQQEGVFSDTTLALTNYGSIHGSGDAVEANAGGTIVNGGYRALGASITGGTVRLGGTGGGGVIHNFATINSFVLIVGGGTVTNGGVEDTTALIDGGGGIYIAGGAGTVSNFATIIAPGPGSNGVNLGGGGAVTNGAATDTTARLQGYTGILMASGEVTNFGLVVGVGVSTGSYGLVMGTTAGASVTNGSGLDTTAAIEGYTAVKLTGPAATVTNFGSIIGQGASAGRYGVYLGGGGTVTNGGGNDHVARIEGGAGVVMKGGAGTVRNLGTIFAGAATGAGVSLLAGGTLVNGSPNNAAALINGAYTGVSLAGAATASNFGTIVGAGDFGGFGAVLSGPGGLTNGAAGHQGALIEGYFGVYATAGGESVTNFGTIEGMGGTAVGFTAAGDTLVIEAGCAFLGAVKGDGGVLDLDSGVGTLSGLFAGGSVTVSGSMAPTTFQAFATVEIGAAATFATSGAVSLATGQTVVSAGALTLGSAKTTVTNGGLIETTGAGILTIAGAVKNNGTLLAAGGVLTVTGAVSGSGAATIQAGLLHFAAAFSQNVTFSGTSGELELAQSQTYAGTVAGFSKTGKTSFDLLDVGFVSAGEATFAGNKSGGVLTVTDGTHAAHIALTGNYLSSSWTAASDGHGGVTVTDPKKAVSAPPAATPFAAAMASLGAAERSPGLDMRTPGRLDEPSAARLAHPAA